MQRERVRLGAMARVNAHLAGDRVLSQNQMHRILVTLCNVGAGADAVKILMEMDDPKPRNAAAIIRGGCGGDSAARDTVFSFMSAQGHSRNNGIVCALLDSARGNPADVESALSVFHKLRSDANVYSTTSAITAAVSVGSWDVAASIFNSMDEPTPQVYNALLGCVANIL